MILVHQGRDNIYQKYILKHKHLLLLDIHPLNIFQKYLYIRRMYIFYSLSYRL